MSKLDLLKFMESFDGEVDVADFSPAELDEFLEKIKNGDEPVPQTAAEFKKRYFEFYDDVKDSTLKRQDW